MLSYVLPNQEKNSSQVISPSRNLSLNLSTTTQNYGAAQEQQQQFRIQQQQQLISQQLSDCNPFIASQAETKEDKMLANITNDAVDERTRLLGDGTPPRSRRQNGGVCVGGSGNAAASINIDNNNSFMNHTNIKHGSAVNAAGNSVDTISSDDLTTTETPTAADAVSFDSELQQLKTTATSTSTSTTKKPKLGKLGSKSGVGLKRVSFGSSKGSMVETLVFETPTPLSEHVEPSFAFEAQTNNYNKAPPNNSYAYQKVNMDDSGIELQEESERSIVRVSIYQSSQPEKIINPPEYLTRFEENLENTFSNYNNLEDIMTAASTIPGYDRQQSTDSGWDNPFRPGGDLSREADEIVNMIRGGKPITPTEDHSLGNGNAQRGGGGAAAGDTCNGNGTETNVTKTNVTQNQSAQNGTNSHGSLVHTTAAGANGGGGGVAATKTNDNNGVTSLGQVSKQVVPGPTSASHVVIDEKKNKKKGCCVIQ